MKETILLWALVVVGGATAFLLLEPLIAAAWRILKDITDEL